MITPQHHSMRYNRKACESVIEEIENAGGLAWYESDETDSEGSFIIKYFTPGQVRAQAQLKNKTSQKTS